MENRPCEVKNYMNNSFIAVSAIRKVRKASERSDYSWKMADSPLSMVWKFRSVSDRLQTPPDSYGFLMYGQKLYKIN